ncbi:flagellar L-ring protein [alpha proteobacterium Q-1]|nr:flagellar L-ring protein [alpha proteobacterium Q-1]
MNRAYHICSQWLKIGLLSASLGACTMGDRLANIGKAPDLAPIENVQAPTRTRSLSLPMMSQDQGVGQANSLWRTGAKAFFRDQRAAQIGDILTVAIEIDDRAEIENETIRSRNNTETAGLDGFLGFEGKLDKVLPNTVNPAALADFGSTSSSTGNGEVDRSETIDLTIAAIVIDVLPNGNLVIQGRQEVRVNFEVRELLIAGIVRPEDISATNIINHSQIAEARISYGGRGQLSDMQQPRYGQQLYDILFPF